MLARMIATLDRRGPDIAVDTGTERWSYRELGARSNQVARLLAGGPRRIGLCAPNSPLWIATYLGAVKAGVEFVPMNPTLSPADVARILDVAECGALAFTDSTRETVERVREVCPDVAPLNLSGHVDQPDGAIDGIRLAPEQITAIPFTSGTTGLPRGVAVTATSTSASLLNSVAAFGFAEALRNLVTNPMASHPVFVGHVLAPLWAGGTVVLRSSYSAEEVAELLVGGEVDFASHVPTTLRRTLRALDGRSVPPGATHMTGSAPVPRRLLEEAIEALGTVVQGWGMTEATNIVTCTSRADLRRRPVPWDRVLSAGRPLPYSEVLIRGDDGVVRGLAPGLAGEAVVRGPIVALGYVGAAPEETPSFRDGALRTGDLIECTEDLCVRVTGRIKELIITGGLNVAPREVEDVLVTHPDCFEVAVVGMPDLEWGERVTAAVVPTRGATLDEEALIRYCRDRLAAYKCPKTVVAVSELPRSPTGKIRRDVLVARLVDR